ncbi:MAG: DUF4352 domain-containing protein [Ktedonobacterales bacterium]|nr:DUF4352 domain-containing protein [Ktedonobacterales bacterium]
MFLRITRLGWGLGLALAVPVLVVGTVALIILTHSAPKHVPQGGSSSTLSMGATARTQQVAVTALSASVLPPDASHRPAANHEFIVVRARLANTSSPSVDYSVEDFSLRAPSGTTYTPDPGAASLANTAALPTQGTLAVGQKIEGGVVFEVPTREHAFQFVWRLHTLPPGTASGIWNVTA